MVEFTFLEGGEGGLCGVLKEDPSQHLTQIKFLSLVESRGSFLQLFSPPSAAGIIRVHAKAKGTHILGEKVKRLKAHAQMRL